MRTFIQFLSALLSLFAILFIIGGVFFAANTKLDADYVVVVVFCAIFFACLSQGLAFVINKLYDI